MDKQLSFIANDGSKPSKDKLKLEIFIDGASRGNPGLAGAGVYIKYDGNEFSGVSAFLGEKTNNQAEYLALALAAYLIKDNIDRDKFTPSQVLITSDSELLVKQMRGEYRVKDSRLRKIKDIALNFLDGLDYSFHHVLRTKNVKADHLANIAIDDKVALPEEFASILRKRDVDV